MGIYPENLYKFSLLYSDKYAHLKPNISEKQVN